MADKKGRQLKIRPVWIVVMAIMGAAVLGGIIYALAGNIREKSKENNASISLNDVKVDNIGKEVISDNADRVQATVEVCLSDCAVTVGTVFKAAAIVTPVNTEQALVWSSNNTGIFEVTQDGVVTVKGVGTAVLTATVGNVSDSVIIEGIGQVTDGSSNNLPIYNVAQNEVTGGNSSNGGSSGGTSNVSSNGTANGGSNTSGGGNSTGSGSTGNNSGNGNISGGSTGGNGGTSGGNSSGNNGGAGSANTSNGGSSTNTSNGGSGTGGGSTGNTSGGSSTNSGSTNGNGSTSGGNSTGNNGSANTSNGGSSGSTGNNSGNSNSSNGGGSGADADGKGADSTQIGDYLPDYGFDREMSNVYVYRDGNTYQGEIITQPNVTIIYIMQRSEAFDEKVKETLAKLLPKEYGQVWNNYVTASSDRTFTVEDRMVRIVVASNGGHSQIVIYN